MIHEIARRPDCVITTLYSPSKLRVLLLAMLMFAMSCSLLFPFTNVCKIYCKCNKSEKILQLLFFFHFIVCNFLLSLFLIAFRKEAFDKLSFLLSRPVPSMYDQEYIMIKYFHSLLILIANSTRCNKLQLRNVEVDPFL